MLVLKPVIHIIKSGLRVLFVIRKPLCILDAMAGGGSAGTFLD